jgi:hypothetical protein
VRPVEDEGLDLLEIGPQRLNGSRPVAFSNRAGLVPHYLGDCASRSSRRLARLEKVTGVSIADLGKLPRVGARFRKRGLGSSQLQPLEA